MKTTQFKCNHCGKVTAGRLPKGGDGSAMFPRRHKYKGQQCPGNLDLAEFVEVPASFNAITGKVKAFKERS